LLDDPDDAYDTSPLDFDDRDVTVDIDEELIDEADADDAIDDEDGDVDVEEEAEEMEAL
jgi:hypothetical protein